LVEKIKPLVRTTRRPGAEAEIGGFGGLFDLKPLQYSDPLLVAATDGVGTKLKIAQAINRHGTIGKDSRSEHGKFSVCLPVFDCLYVKIRCRSCCHERERFDCARSRAVILFGL